MKKQMTIKIFQKLPNLVRFVVIIFMSIFFISCSVNPAALPNAVENSGKTPTAELFETATYTPSPTNTKQPSPVPISTSRPNETVMAGPDLSSLNACLSANAKVEQGTVVKITDGDTIQVNINGTVYKLRYIGMDTPEVNQLHFQEAYDRNSALVYQKKVVLVKDHSETDRYDRLLRYVFVDGVFVNEILVKEGFATAKDYPPDSSCKTVLSNAQADAITQGIGVWLPVPTVVQIVPTLALQNTPTTPPVVSTAVIQPTAVASSGCPQGCFQQMPGCIIKGNINSDGVKIYHTPSSSSYSRTIIDPSKGERWFCTEQEAVTNGWRAPK